MILKFASSKLYKVTVDAFPGAIYLFDGSIDFLGLNSIDFQQDVQPDFQQSSEHSVVLIALLKIP